MSKNNPRISVIITTLNRENDIGLTLDRLAEQSLAPDDFEILVVDGGSTDGTEEVVLCLAVKYPKHAIRFLIEHEPGVTAARHLGVKEARGEILTFIEDDARAESRTLEAILECFADPSVHLVGGRCLPDYDEPPPVWLESFFERMPDGFRCGALSLIDLGDRVHETSPHNVWALNFSIRKKTLLELGGFHPDLMPPGFKEFQGDGESGVSRKIEEKGLKTLYHPEVVVHHRIQADRFDVSYFEKRFRFQGICDSYTALRAGQSVEDKRGAVVPSGIQKTISLILSPHRLLYVLGRKLLMVLRARSSEADVDNRTGDRNYRQALAAYRAGFEFHRHAVRKNPILLDWILRDDYFNSHVQDYVQGRLIHD